MGVRLEIPRHSPKAYVVTSSVAATSNLAFMLATWNEDEATVTDLRPVASAAFDLQTPWHISLSDKELAIAIKWAHDHDATLIEAHVHRDGDPAEFSPSDWLGLDSFVPHVWWRLRHRPYVALVFGETTFDGLVWRSGPTTPEPLEALRMGISSPRAPTERSLRRQRKC